MRHDHRPAIREVNRRDAVRARHRIHRLIEARRREDPVAPEPVELHSRLIPHQAEEIRRRWMLECPRLDVVAKRWVETLLAEHFIAEQLHHQRWLLVAAPEQVAHLDRL